MDVFRAVQAEYDREGVRWDHVEYEVRWRVLAQRDAIQSGLLVRYYIV